MPPHVDEEKSPEVGMNGRKPVWEKLFHHSSYRMTPQRKAVLEILQENRGRHLSVKDIHTLIQQKKQQVGLTTIYRTLHLLRQLNIVKEVELGENRRFYELDLPGLTHSHFICLKCRKILETAPVQLAEWSENLPDEDVTLTDYSLRLFGYCSDCQVSR